MVAGSHCGGGGTPGRQSHWLAELLKEMRLILAGRVCHPERQAHCRAEDQEFATWACGYCHEYIRPERISPWSRHVLFLYRLQEAGYPLRGNDLSLETWMILGMMKRLNSRLVEEKRHATA